MTKNAERPADQGFRRFHSLSAAGEDRTREGVNGCNNGEILYRDSAPR